ncbi:MAG: ABC transporter permease [Terracidiphilus sp.]|nr:ABC transporter permease [Terracidiphilus sp.]
MSAWSGNLRLAARQLRRNPGFTATVIVTLALAIGANTAIFSIVNALLVKPLPYPEPQRMGTIFTQIDGGHPLNGRDDIDGTQWEALRDNVPSLMAAVYSEMATGANLRAGSAVRYVHDGRVSAQFFSVLGVQPALGRGFTTEEDRPKGPAAVVLSYDLWRTTFGADRGIVGRAIQLKSASYTVVGVLPQGAVTPLNADLYTPLQPSRDGEGQGANYGLLTRLKPGATWQQADAEVNRAWAAQVARYAARNQGAHVRYLSVPLQQGQASELKPRALALQMAAGFILLIACANLAGLTLVRVTRRTPEIATRLALGGSRWQVQKQLWMENLLLALVGGAAGVGTGYVALKALLKLLPEDYLPVTGIGLDVRVLGFALAAALGTSILFGMLPALAVRRVDLRSSMANRAVAGGERVTLRQALIAGEVALTVVLLAGAGLLIRTLVHLETLPPGFNPEGVLSAKASLDDARFRDPAAFAKLLSESVAAMERIPGVQRAAVGLNLPYERPLNDEVSVRDGTEAGYNAASDAIYATPGYFDALGIPLLAGRKFTAADTATTAPIAVVNRAFARKFFHGANPVGHGLDKTLTIVGEVGDVQVSPGLDVSAPLTIEPTIYIPATQVSPGLLAVVHAWFQPSWVVKTAGPTTGLEEQMQQAMASVDAGLPFSGFYRMTDLRARSLAMERIEVTLLGTMAGLALLLSAVGLSGLVASLVAQRTREIGLRIALGSTVERAMAHVAGTGVRAAVAGMALGLMASFGALRLLRSVLYGVAVYDATSLAAVVATLALVTLAATTLPALRIARIDPARTLRDE